MVGLNNYTVIGFLVLVYIFASVPYGFLLVKAIRKEDIRKFGSGNIGATNVARRLGLGWGVFTFILDFLKGFIPVYWVSILAKSLNSSHCLFYSYLPLVTALLCVLAHNYSLFLRFKGGKGVSTSIGVIAALSLTNVALRLPLFLSILTWGVVFFGTRIVALASLSAALLFFLSCIFLRLEREFIILSFLIFVFIVFRHRSNIKKIKEKNVN